MLALPQTDQAKATAQPKPRATARDGESASASNPVWQSLAMRAAAVQPKLSVSQPDDPDEREADRIADKVIRMHEPRLQRACDSGESSEHRDARDASQHSQAESVRSDNSAEGVAPSVVHEALHSSGQPLDTPTREFMESRFGHDFSSVRIHQDNTAAYSARAFSARAYTFGRNIVFGASQLAPETSDGRRLLAHELAHVLQQRAATASSGDALATSRAGARVQRQPAGTTGAATPTPADNIRDATALLKTVQPVFIHQALSKVSVGGGSVQVHSVEHVIGGKPVTSVFTLELKVAPLTGFQLALFQASPTPTQSGATRTFAMTITVSDTVANSTPQALAKDLFHEGMHMQLFVDRTGPSWSSSLHLKGLQDYLATARKNPNHAQLLTDLTAFIKKNGTGKTQAVAASEAKEIVEKIIEEKYVMDVTEQSSLGSKSTPLPSSAKQQLYLSLTSRWLVTYLGMVGASNGPQAMISSMASQLRVLWSDIDANAPRPPLYPVPVGKYGGHEPDILPPPLPAPL